MNTITIKSNIEELYNFGDILKRVSSYYILTSTKDSHICNIVGLSDGCIFNIQTQLVITDKESLNSYFNEYGFTKLPKGTKITLSCNE